MVLALVLPLQAFLGNSSLYAFGMARLVFELCVVSVVLTLVLFLLFLISARFLCGALHGIIIGATVCVYVEAGPLSAGLPEINGAFMPELAVVSRGVVDCAVWAALIVGGLAACRWLRRWGHLVAIGLLVLGIASLVDVKRDEEAPAETEGRNGGPASGFEWQRDIVENFKFSRDRNVLVFILDSMPCNYSTDLMLSAPDLAAKFPGFVAFTNNVGMHDCTKRGLPGLMTGRYFDPRTSSKAEFPMSIFGSESFLAPYIAAGAEVSFSPEFLPYGYTNAKVEKRMKVAGRQKHGWAALLLRSREIPYLSLFDVTVFRIAPYVAKAPFLYAKIRHDPMFEQDESNFWYEHAMFPHLAAVPFTSAKTVLGVFHTRGAHPPLLFDQDGRRLPRKKGAWENVSSLPMLVRNPIHNLGKLMDALRERGIYDKSLIVVVADHGAALAPCPPGGHNQSESAILWVKVEGATGPFSYSGIPTGYSRVAPFMKSAVTSSPDAAAVESALREENRLFRYLDANDRYHDIVVGPDGDVVKKEDL